MRLPSAGVVALAGDTNAHDCRSALVGLARVPEADSGAAASLLNAGRQAGGSIGLAVLGTVAWTVVSDSVRPGRCGCPGGSQVSAALQAAAYQHALGCPA
jgi:hypothetical protein